MFLTQVMPVVVSPCLRCALRWAVSACSARCSERPLLFDQERSYLAMTIKLIIGALFVLMMAAGLVRPGTDAAEGEESSSD